MKLLQTLLTLTIVLVNGQDEGVKQLVGDFFGTASSRDPFDRLVEVTSQAPQSFGSLDRCGEGSDQGVHSCVPYHQCDGITKLIIQDGRTDGFGLIDIRFGANECEHFLDVCCGLPPGDNVRGPDIGVPVVSPVTPVNPPVTSENPPVVTPVSPPVTPVNPPVTPVNPPVTPVIPPVTPVSPPVTPATPRPSSVFCGIRNPDGIDFKITGDRDNEAEYGEFPWMVAILRTNFDPSRNQNLAVCGGSLIAPNVVLTAAHCVAGLKTNQYKVRVGEWDTQTDKERLPYQERDVVQAIIHEAFVAETVYNDLALLILSSPIDQADNTGTICLPNQDEVITSRKCFASGWGKDAFGKEGKYEVILKKIELPMVQWEPCQQALRTTRLSQTFQLHRSFICAGGEAGKDTCTGDGGSPLVCPDPRNPNRYVQAGIVSWGIGCGEKNIPGVYANVAKFRKWIDQKLSRLNINSDPYNV